MHILTATIEALEISVDELVLNRTTLQQKRKENRHQESDDAKYELSDKVIVLNLNNYYLIYARSFRFVFCLYVIVKKIQMSSSSLRWKNCTRFDWPQECR